MCQPASFIITKGPKALWSKTSDTHSDIRKEYSLPENGLRIVNVQVEITPPNDDFSVPLEDWTFHVDQDLFPDWWDAADAETEVRRELENWARVRLVRAGETRDVRNGEYVTAVLSGGVVDEILGGTVSEIHGGAVNRVYDGTVNRVYGGVVNRVYGGTVSEIHGGTVSEILGGTVSEIHDGTVNRVYDGTVNRVYGGTVSEIHGGTVSYYCPFVTELKGETTVVIDRTRTKARCFIGRDNQRTISSSDLDDNL